MTARQRRLVFLCPFPPRLDGLNGGSRVTAQLISALCQRHHVAVFCLRSDAELPADARLIERCEVFEEIRRPVIAVDTRRSWRWRVKFAYGLVRGRPLWVHEWHVSDFAGRVAGFVRDWQPDVIQYVYHIMGQYSAVAAGSRARQVLIEFEPGVRAATDALAVTHGFAKVWRAADLFAWHRYERALLATVDTVVVFSEHDRRTLQPHARHTPLVCIPFGTAIPAVPANPVGNYPPSLVFVGNFTHLPNVDAAIRLASVIFPAVRDQFPDPELRLYLVGEGPPHAVQRLANEHVIVTGEVPDVTPFLDRAAVVVAPLTLGGGMRVKVAEALAAGKAVVATPLAVAGFGVTDGQQILLASGNEPFAAAILRLLCDTRLREQIARQARAWAAAHLDWNASVAAYERVYAQLCDP